MINHVDVSPMFYDEVDHINMAIPCSRVKRSAGVLQAPCTLYREPEFINYRTIIVHFGASLTPVEASSD